MRGHTGGAYGLVSNMFYDPESKAGFVFACNGGLGGYLPGNNSAFILVE